MSRTSAVSMEYVYSCEKTNDYCSVRVSLELSTDPGMGKIIVMRPEVMMTPGEANSILRDFEADVLDKLRLDAEFKFPVEVLFEDKLYHATLDHMYRITGLVLA